MIEWAAGIGKSSLLGATAQMATGMTVLRARGAAMEREFALGVVLQLLAPSIEPLTDREREEIFAGAAGLARLLFEEVPDRAAAEDRLFARFHGLHWLCAGLAEERPLALLVDDAQWADEQSLRFLAYLAALLARQLIAALEDRRSVDAGAVAAMGPPSVARFVTGRPRGRPPAVAAVARALTLLGADASLAVTAEVAGVDRDTAAEAVDALIEAELLHPGLPPSFVHPIIHRRSAVRHAAALRNRSNRDSSRLGSCPTMHSMG